MQKKPRPVAGHDARHAPNAHPRTTLFQKKGNCAYGESCGCFCANGTSASLCGQTCFWFSQGCTIGCPTCTGVNARAQIDVCGLGKKPTICDPRLRTYNVGAECNSAQDIYKHNPWRAPNTAPVFDPCGKAGGGYPGVLGPGAAGFINTTNAKHGDLGTAGVLMTYYCNAACRDVAKKWRRIATISLPAHSLPRHAHLSRGQSLPFILF